MKTFSGYHPLVLFIYFLAVFFITMFSMNPLILSISLSGGICLTFKLTGIKKTALSLLYSFSMFVLIVITNPLFSHRGETILFFLNDNPVTLESIYYGIAIGMLIFSVFYWFKCYNEVMTSDKFIYLFGKAAPKLSLVLSMALRLVPKFKQQIKRISHTQKAMGMYTSKSITDRILGSVRVISILITWSLENAIDTSDSMKARGYGLKGRTAYSIFRFTKRDGIILALTALTGSIAVFALLSGLAAFTFYPSISIISTAASETICYIAMAVLMFIPLAAEIWEDMKWHYLRQKI